MQIGRNELLHCASVKTYERGYVTKDIAARSAEFAALAAARSSALEPATDMTAQATLPAA